MKKYGLLGEKLGHSYSKIIHNEIFEKMNIDASYDLIEIPKEELKQYLEYLKEGKYHGFNITIPYKIEVIPYLDEISLEAKKIGSVNTIVKKEDKIVGYNTDYYGFLQTLDVNQISCKDKTCYILGTGGASLAVKQALLDKGGKVIFVSRNKTGEDIISYFELEKLDKIEILVNTTPVGMYPDVYSSPIRKEVAEKVEVCIDIIFNPEETKLLSMVKKGYNGLQMLISQAVKAEEIWSDTSLNIKENELMRLVAKKIHE